jgi:hypothetical protein
MAYRLKDLLGSASGVYDSGPERWHSDNEVVLLAELEFRLLALVDVSNLPANLTKTLDRVRIPVEPKDSEGRDFSTTAESLKAELSEERLKHLGLGDDEGES